jgi:hypothetical protein
MIRKDYKWPSTGRRRREARVKKFSEAFLFAACLNLVGVSLAVLVPQGMWVYLFTLAVGVTGVSVMVMNFFKE